MSKKSEIKPVEVLSAGASKYRTLPGFRSSPIALFATTMGTIFLVELLVMSLLPLLPEMSTFLEGAVDSVLLSVIVFPILYLLFFKPLTENIRVRRRTEKEKEEIQEMDQLKSEFISTAAHEIRNPLTCVMGYSELLISKELFRDEDRQQYLSIIHEKSMVLDRIVEDLLDLSRIASGQLIRIQKEPQDLALMIKETVDRYRKENPERCIQAHIASGMPPILLDRVRIGQVLDNLFGNAIKYSPGGTEIKIKVELRPKDTLIQLQDYGMGMTQEQLDHVFDKFYRANPTETDVQGLGLGMAIVKSYVEGHQGEVWIESQPGEGTRVSFTLPLGEC